MEREKKAGGCGNTQSKLSKDTLGADSSMAQTKPSDPVAKCWSFGFAGKVALPPAAEDKQHRDQTPVFTVTNFVQYYNAVYVGKVAVIGIRHGSTNFIERDIRGTHKPKDRERKRRDHNQHEQQC